MTTPHGKHPETIVHEREPFNAEPSRGLLARSALTATDAFYARNHGAMPDVDPVGWRLRIDGLVGRPLQLSLPELQDGRFAVREEVATLQCAGNRREGLVAVRDIPGDVPWGPGATGTATWRGVSLADVLATAAPAASATDVAFVGLDLLEESDPSCPASSVRGASSGSTGSSCVRHRGTGSSRTSPTACCPSARSPAPGAGCRSARRR
jgi:sulfite oxidase